MMHWDDSASSMKLNDLVNANSLEPFGNNSTMPLFSERIIGQKRYELTNHLGNVMAVTSDKITEVSTTTNAPDVDGEASNKRASLQAAYDYYPFGMLMPMRYIEDNTQQCTPQTITHFVRVPNTVNHIGMDNPADIGFFSVEGGVINGDPSWEEPNGEVSGSLVLPLMPDLDIPDGGLEFASISFTDIVANKDFKVQTHVRSEEHIPVLVEVLQENANSELQLLAVYEIPYDANATIEATAISGNPVVVKYKTTGAGGTMRIKTTVFETIDIVNASYVTKICNNEFSFGKDYRFGYSGHEKDNEIKGIGNSLNMGARMYDSRLGRTPSRDPKAALYPSISPYAYSLNTPIQAKDPDGNVVIFINGQHTGEGGKSDYWRVFKDIKVGTRSEKDGFGRWHTSDITARRETFAFDKAVMNRIGDHKAIYKDGAMGGFKNTLTGGGNLDVGYRQACGVVQGMADAKSIIANLQRDENGKITESIKIVSHSMGGAYAKGYASAILNYAKENKIDGVNIEFEVDFAPFQPNKLSTVPGLRTIQASHKYDKVVNNFIKIGGSEEAKQEGVDDNDYHLNTTDKDKGHSIFNFTDEINTTVPQSSNNPR